MENLELNIAHLYPDLLNANGVAGNVLTFVKRCEWRGIKVNIDYIGIGDDIEESKYDFYFMGDCQTRQQIQISYDLQFKKGSFKRIKERGAVLLAIGCGYQLLGHYYQPHNAEKIAGTSLLDIYTISDAKRFTGNVTAKIDESIIVPDTLVGFENHYGLTYLESGTRPLANIITGLGNNGTDKTEGAQEANVFGTYLHGPLLAINPHFADYLISLALEHHYKTQVELKKFDDTLEMTTHTALIGKPY